jgi:hypothetical protein
MNQYPDQVRDIPVTLGYLFALDPQLHFLTKQSQTDNRFANLEFVKNNNNNFRRCWRKFVGVCQGICDCVCVFYKSWIWGSHFEEEECFVVGQILCFWRFCPLTQLLLPKSSTKYRALKAQEVTLWERERERVGEMWSDALAWFARERNLATFLLSWVS